MSDQEVKERGKVWEDWRHEILEDVCAVGSGREFLMMGIQRLDYYKQGQGDN